MKAAALDPGPVRKVGEGSYRYQQTPTLSRPMVASVSELYGGMKRSKTICLIVYVIYIIIQFYDVTLFITYASSFESVSIYHRRHFSVLTWCQQLRYLAGAGILTLFRESRR